MSAGPQEIRPATPIGAMTAVLGGVGIVAARQTLAAMALPFDAARDHYARSVHAGLVPNSMLASCKFERALGVLEQLTLGPLARRV